MKPNVWEDMRVDSGSMRVKRGKKPEEPRQRSKNVLLRLTAIGRSSESLRAALGVSGFTAGGDSRETCTERRTSDQRMQSVFALARRGQTPGVRATQGSVALLRPRDRIGNR
jgi:hypothetical protein